METPANLRYLATHQWAQQEDDGTITVGITDYAQQQLGDVVFVELPEVGRGLTQAEVAGVVESVKAASDYCCPLTGTVIAVNPRLEDQSEVINESPYGEGWIFKLQPEDLANEWDNLLDAEAYDAVCAAEQDDD